MSAVPAQMWQGWAQSRRRCSEDGCRSGRKRERCACGAGTIGEALLKRGALAHLVLVNLECNDITDHAKAILHQARRTRCRLHAARGTPHGVGHHCLCTGRRYRACAPADSNLDNVSPTYSTTRVTRVAACNEHCAALCRTARGLCWSPCRIGTAAGSAPPIWACWPRYRLC